MKITVAEYFALPHPRPTAFQDGLHVHGIAPVVGQEGYYWVDLTHVPFTNPTHGDEPLELRSQREYIDEMLVPDDLVGKVLDAHHALSDNPQLEIHILGSKNEIATPQQQAMGEPIDVYPLTSRPLGDLFKKIGKVETVADYMAIGEPRPQAWYRHPVYGEVSITIREHGFQVGHYIASYGDISFKIRANDSVLVSTPQVDTEAQAPINYRFTTLTNGNIQIEVLSEDHPSQELLESVAQFSELDTVNVEWSGGFDVLITGRKWMLLGDDNRTARYGVAYTISPNRAIDHPLMVYHGVSVLESELLQTNRSPRPEIVQSLLLKFI